MKQRDDFQSVEAEQEDELLICLAERDLTICTDYGLADWNERALGINRFFKRPYIDESTAVAVLLKRKLRLLHLNVLVI